MKKGTVLTLWILLCATLLFFTACGTAFAIPNVEDRPQTSPLVSDGDGQVGYQPPTAQTAVTKSTDETQKNPPAYWRGQSHTLPPLVSDSVQQSSESTAVSQTQTSQTIDHTSDGGAPRPQVSATPGSDAGSSDASEPDQTTPPVTEHTTITVATTTEPPHTTATTPDPSGFGRGDAFDVVEKSGNGTKVVQCTPFY